MCLAEARAGVYDARKGMVVVRRLPTISITTRGEDS